MCFVCSGSLCQLGHFQELQTVKVQSFICFLAASLGDALSTIVVPNEQRALVCFSVCCDGMVCAAFIYVDLEKDLGFISVCWWWYTGEVKLSEALMYWTSCHCFFPHACLFLNYLKWLLNSYLTFYLLHICSHGVILQCA